MLLVAFLLGLACTARAAPSFQAAGTAVNSAAAVAVAWPAHIAGDVALLFVESEGDEAVTLSTAAGFASIGQTNITSGGSGGTRLTVFWARATSSAMASPTIANPDDHVYAQILTYRGVVSSGNPWDVTAGGTSASGTSVSLASVTTTVAQTLVVQVASRNNDSAAAAFSGYANANLTGITERSDAGTTTGTGGGFAVWDGVKATAGATGATTATVTTSSNAYRTIALEPVQPTLDSATIVCGSSTQVEVQFSAPVTSASATNASNYTLSGGAMVSAAVLDAGGQVVTLTTSNLDSGETYTLTVNNIAATSGGVIAAGSQTTFFSEGGYLSGLPGIYYSQNGTSGAFFTGTQVRRVDPQVNFDWAAGVPGPAGIAADNFSVRWTGFVTAPVTGNYTFRTGSDDGVRLYVNGVLVIDNWTDHSVTNNDSGAIALTAGQRTALIMEFYERGGEAVAQLGWSGPATGGSVPIPRASLSHFCGTPTPRAIYTMDESSWNGTAGEVADSSGNGLNGTAVGGAVPVSARVCNGGQFNGSSRYVQVGTGLSDVLNSTASLAFWINTTQTGNNVTWQAPGVTGVELNGTGNDIFWGWLDAAGRIGISVGDTATTKSTVAVNDGTWHHIVLTRDHVLGTYKIYVDGVLNASGAIATGIIGTSYSSIGRIEDTGGTPEYLNGLLDEVRVYDQVLTDSDVTTIRNITRPCAGPDHYSISGNTTAVTCDATTVQVTAHSSAHGLVSPSAGTILTLTTSTGTGAWQAGLAGGTGTWTPSGANNGSAIYVWPGGESTFSVTLRHNTVATVGVNVADSGGKNEIVTEDLAIAFVSSALRVTTNGTSTATIGTQLSGKNSNTGFGAQTLYLQAIRTDTNTGSCVGLIQNRTVTIEMAAARVNPTGSASQVSVMNSSGTLVALGTGAGVAGAYTNVFLTFDADSKAPLVLNYPNAGSVSLFARYQLPTPPSGTYLTGTSNPFVVRPFGLRISGPPSGVTGSGSLVYARAGATWPQAVTVTAVAWATGEDADNNGVPDSDAVLAGNATTTNFGAETSPATAVLTHTLAEPSGGSAGTLTAPLSAFGGGVATAPASWSEVGIINLFAISTSYLGTGQNVRNSADGFLGVGRFYPYDFAVSRNTPSFAPACSTGNFTYVGQQFNYAVAPVLTVTARNQAGGTTQNYAGTFMKITNALITPNSNQTARYARFDALGGTTPILDLGGFPAVASDPAIGTFTNGVGMLTFSGGTTGAFFARTTPVAPFNADISLAFSLTDSDSVPVGSIDGVAASNPVRFGTVAAAGNGIAFTGNAKQMRYGRLRLQSANGSERLVLPMRVEAQYWNGSGFVINGSDGCTALAASNVAFANYRGNLASGETTASLTPFSGGVSTLRLSAPGAGNNGGVDISLNLGATTAGASCIGGMAASTASNLSWLQGSWCGTPYDDDPGARATFGLYSGPNQFIYRRENY